MDYQGIFIGDGKNEHYNRMFNQVNNAGLVDAELAARMRQKFRELRQINREWSRLLDELRRK